MIVRLLGELGLRPSHLELHAWLDQSHEDETFSPEEQDPFSQRFLLSQAIQMALKDGDYSGEERACIERWAVAWQISDEELAELEAELLKESPDGVF